MTARLVFDGDCGFCRYTVGYACAVTKDRVEYRPYQEVAGEHPELTEAQFVSSIRLFHDKQVYAGADAAFRTLALGGRGFWHALYRRVPGFAPLTEWLYGIVSRHRVGAMVISKWLFGSELRPARFEQTADWLYRGVLLMAVFALASLWWQLDALIGSRGILPVAEFLDSVRDQIGSEALWRLPTLLWVSAGDWMLHGLCAVGLIACCLGLAGRARVTAALVTYAVYLSLFYGGQVFMGYQWDLLLIECLFLCAILSVRPVLGVWLFRLLLLRFMLLSGAVKLLSADPTWADGSALNYHFETQPLPNVLAWYAHQLPDWFLEFGVFMTFVIELVFAFFIFLPRNLRLVACAGFVLLEVLIGLTGSYNFFNLLTVVMCISLLDDRLVGRLPRLRGVQPRRFGRWLAVSVGALIGILGLTVVQESLTQQRHTNALLTWVDPARTVNGYGLFAVMTTHRDELVVEGSMDGETWHAYEFPFKPGEIARRPALATPHQPRIDWQLWFAALTTMERAPWVYGLARSLLRAEPAVLTHLHDPFAGVAPQRVRIVRYRYRFTTPEERRTNGGWWTRQRIGPWSPQMRIDAPAAPEH